MKLGHAARWLFSPPPAGRLARRLSQLFVGLVIYGVSDALLVLGGLGLDPWDVLHPVSYTHLTLPTIYSV